MVVVVTGGEKIGTVGKLGTIGIVVIGGGNLYSGYSGVPRGKGGNGT